MKKRSFMLIVATIMLVLCFSLSSCSGLKGKSAYEIACENGFVGTEQEWIESLKGKNGEDSAIDIYQLYKAYLLENPNAVIPDIDEDDIIGETDKDLAKAIIVFKENTAEITGTGASFFTNKEYDIYNANG